MRKIAIQNLKGGTAKTTTVVSLAYALAKRKKKVLCIDCDPQGNTKEAFGIKNDITMYDLLVEDRAWTDCITHARENIDCIISNNTLAASEIQLVSFPRREEILSVRLKNLRGYDFVIIDCSPSLSLVNQNALLYADEVLIPISMDFLAMLGAKQVLNNLDMVEKYFEKSLKVVGVLPTFYDERTNISREVLESLKKVYKNKVLPTIRIDTKLAQAMSARKTIFEYNGESRAAKDYEALAKRISSK